MDDDRTGELERWHVASRNAAGSCLSSTLGLVVLVAALSGGGFLGSLLAGSVGAVVVALMVVAIPVYACLRVRVERLGTELRIINRFRSLRVPVAKVVDVSAGFLDRDPKSPPVLVISFWDGRDKKEVQLDATASSSASERAEVAEKFRSIGLKAGPERRYVEW